MVLDKKNKVAQGKAVIALGTEKEKKNVAERRTAQNILPDNSKEHLGIQNCNTC